LVRLGGLFVSEVMEREKQNLRPGKRVMRVFVGVLVLLNLALMSFVAIQFLHLHAEKPASRENKGVVSLTRESAISAPKRESRH
jgi:hypothetical protein